MSTLPNYPMVAQRSDLTADNLPSENKAMNCVPSSILSMIMYLKGITTVDKEWDPDRILNMAYPEGYQGGTTAKAFVAACLTLGVHLFPVDGDNATLVSKAHQYLAQGKPVLFTIVDPYMPASSGYTHVCVWYADGPGTLTAMDPWPARPVTHSDAEWEAVMRFNEVWIAERIDETVKIDITTPGVDGFYEEVDAHHWKCKQTGHILQYAILDFYKGYSNADLCGVTWLGLPKTDEIPIETLRPPTFAKYAGHGIVVQFLECGVACYDPGHLVDQRPGLEGHVYLLQLYNNGPGVDPGIAKQQAIIADLTAANAMQAQKITDLQQGQAIDPLASQALSVVRQVKPLFQPF
jgi:hypothetical protein